MLVLSPPFLLGLTLGLVRVHYYDLSRPLERVHPDNRRRRTSLMGRLAPVRVQGQVLQGSKAVP